MIEMASRIWECEIDGALIERAKRNYAGPYRAMSAYVGDEHIGARDWPWIVVGSAGINCFGRLWSRAYAEAVASEMNSKE